MTQGNCNSKRAARLRVILADLHMPDISGSELCKRLVVSGQADALSPKISASTASSCSPIVDSISMNCV